MLSLVGKDLKSLSERNIGTGVNIQHLDVSANQLNRGIEFNPFTNLVTLIIDENLFSNLTDFPLLKFLETFSANKNNFSDLPLFLEEAQDKFGNLKNLSLLKNPLNPFFEGEHKYNIYRDHILVKFGDLKTLDGCAIQIMKRGIVEKKK